MRREKLRKHLLLPLHDLSFEYHCWSNIGLHLPFIAYLIHLVMLKPWEHFVGSIVKDACQPDEILIFWIEALGALKFPNDW